MAESRVATNDGIGKVDWRAERQKMAALVTANILDPIALIAGLFIENNAADASRYSLDLDEAGKVLKLMIEGAHVELGLYGSSLGGSATPPLAAILSHAWEVRS